jgi:hypothetical protein
MVNKFCLLKGQKYVKDRLGSFDKINNMEKGCLEERSTEWKKLLGQKSTVRKMLG